MNKSYMQNGYQKKNPFMSSKTKTKTKQTAKENVLDISFFPELGKKNKASNTMPVISPPSYIDHVKQENILKKDTVCDLDSLPEGWVQLQQGSKHSVHRDATKPNNMCILNALCDKYEKRTEEYIDLYGYDIWENLFQFPIQPQMNADDEDEDEDEEEYEDEYDIE